jgi:hypothetical protein
MDALVGALRALGEPVVRGGDARPGRSVRSMIDHFAAAHTEAGGDAVDVRASYPRDADFTAPSYLSALDPAHPLHTALLFAEYAAFHHAGGEVTFLGDEVLQGGVHTRNALGSAMLAMGRFVGLYPSEPGVRSVAVGDVGWHTATVTIHADAMGAIGGDVRVSRAGATVATWPVLTWTGVSVLSGALADRRYVAEVALTGLSEGLVHDLSVTVVDADGGAAPELAATVQAQDVRVDVAGRELTAEGFGHERARVTLDVYFTGAFELAVQYRATSGVFAAATATEVAPVAADARSFQVELAGLTDNTTYDVRAQLRDGAVQGTWKLVEGVFTTTELPPPIAALRVEGRTYTSVAFAWDPVTATPPVLDYRLTWTYVDEGFGGDARATPVVTAVTGTAYDVTDLAYGSTIRVAVEPRNGNGLTRQPVEVDAAVTPAIAPGVPTAPVQEGSYETRLVVVWGAVASAPAVHTYEVQYGDGQVLAHPAADGTRAVVDGLPGTSTFQVRVRAVSLVGAGDWTAFVAMYTADTTAPLLERFDVAPVADTGFEVELRLTDDAGEAAATPLPLEVLAWATPAAAAPTPVDEAFAPAWLEAYEARHGPRAVQHGGAAYVATRALSYAYDGGAWVPIGSAVLYRVHVHARDQSANHTYAASDVVQTLDLTPPTLSLDGATALQDPPRVQISGLYADNRQAVGGAVHVALCCTWNAASITEAQALAVTGAAAAVHEGGGFFDHVFTHAHDTATGAVHAILAHHQFTVTAVALDDSGNTTLRAKAVGVADVAPPDGDVQATADADGVVLDVTVLDDSVGDREGLGRVAVDAFLTSGALTLAEAVALVDDPPYGADGDGFVTLVTDYARLAAAAISARCTKPLDAAYGRALPAVTFDTSFERPEVPMTYAPVTEAYDAATPAALAQAFVPAAPAAPAAAQPPVLVAQWVDADAAAFAWAARSDGGSATLGFTLALTGRPAVALDAAARYAEVGGLAPSTDYAATLVKHTAHGDVSTAALAVRTAAAPPAAPALSIAAARTSAVDLAWQPGADGDAAVARLLLLHRAVGDAAFAARALPADAVAATVDGLASNTEYAFRVDKVTDLGDARSDELVQRTAAVASAAPALEVAALGTDYALLRWRPGDAGDEAVAAFAVEHRRVGDPTFATQTADAAARELRIDGLASNAAYEFRVTALTGGTDPASPVLTARTRAVPPDPPSLQVTAVGTDSVALELEPGADHDATASALAVEYRRAADAAFVSLAAAAGALTVAGLDSDTPYVLFATKQTDAGTVASAELLVRTQRRDASPAVVTVVAATAHAVALAWTIDAGDATLLGLRLRYKRAADADDELLELGADARAVTVDQLQSATTYDLELAVATDLVDPSPTALTVTTAAVPLAAPVLTLHEAAVTEVEVRWTVDAGDAVVSGVDAQWLDGAEWRSNPLPPDATAFRFVGLASDTAHSFRVVARSDPDAVSDVLVARTAPQPAAAATVSAVAEDVTALTVAWAPGELGDAVLVDYLVVSGEQRVRVHPSLTEATLVGLASNSAHALEVITRTTLNGDPREAAVQAVARTLPSPPTLAVSDVQTTQLTVQWSGIDLGDTSVAALTLEVRDSPDGAFGPRALDVAASAHTLTGLASDTAYELRLAVAYVGTGNEARSAVVAQRTAAVPPGDPVLSATVDGAAVTVAWDAGPNGDATVTSYTLEYRVPEAEVVERVFFDETGLVLQPTASTVTVTVTGIDSVEVQWAEGESSAATTLGYTLRYKPVALTQYTEVAFDAAGLLLT